MSAPDAEDVKLLTLARAAQARMNARQGAAVRDLDGRTYVATAVALPSLTLSALQVAVAMALSSGAPGLEAAVVVGDPDGAGVTAVLEMSTSAGLYTEIDGALVALDAQPSND